MYVEKIEIPAFRALRDVVLDFSGGYDPQVFPLGSQNGGGKSTLLQLVFALLHCTGYGRPLVSYLRNLMATDSRSGDESRKTIARFTIRLDDDTKVLEFLSLDERFLEEKLGEKLEYGFGTAHQRSVLQRKASAAERTGTAFQDRQNSLSADWDRIQNLMKALGYDFIVAYQSSTPSDRSWYGLVCHVHDHSIAETSPILEAIRDKVFLLGPSNQQYLFLDSKTRGALLAPRIAEDDFDQYDHDHPPPDPPQVDYIKALEKAESDLRGFYAYDWISVAPLLRLFKQASKEDLEAMVKTGKYGERFKTILAEVNDLLFGKKVRPLPDLSGVEFLIEDGQGNELALRPEDLSQGELKRLLMFAWLRANDATDALVLIDEIETSFHPDWQRGIVRDLRDWGPTNQYILATHSYELCQALTPRHVKELEPRLSRTDAGKNDG